MVTQFQERVYALLRRVPKGKVTTYGELAAGVGIGSARAVGQAMRCNPYAPHVPCHRVVASDGGIGGFSGQSSGDAIRRKVALLRAEGVPVEDNRIVDFAKRRHRFTHGNLRISSPRKRARRQ